MTPLSWEHLRDIRDQLRRPLSDREVLIPLTGKAFLLGRLAPATISSGSDNNHSTRDTTVEELVHVRVDHNGNHNNNNNNSSSTKDHGITEDLGVYLTEMTRKQALDLLGSEMDRLVKKTDRPKPQHVELGTTAAAAAAAPNPTVTVAPPNFTSSSNQPDHDDHDGDGGANEDDDNNNNNHTNQPPFLPLCEIREELDEVGREVRGEVVPISDLLATLFGEHGNSVDVGGNAPQRDPAAATHNSTTTPTDAVSTSSSTAAAASSIDVSSSYHPEPPEAATSITRGPRPVVSEQEYAAISTRLDQLARLEEEAEQEQRHQQQGKRSSKGWSKGFLNKDKNKKVRPPTRAAVGVKPTTSTPITPTTTLPPTTNMGQYPEARNNSGIATALNARRNTTTDVTHTIAPAVFSGVVQERKPELAHPGDTATYQYSTLQHQQPQQQLPEDMEVAESGRKVVFATSNEVREIPRIGMSPVPPRRSNNGVGPIQLIDNNARQMMPTDHRELRPGQATRTETNNNNNHQSVSLPPGTTTNPGKKLSRFAQERQGLR